MSVRLKTLPLPKTKTPLLRVNGDFEGKLRWLIADGLHAVFMFISPAVARTMMERNGDEEWRNRTDSPALQERYGRAMSEDRWTLTGETIIFSISGYLLNGQNRLKACIAASRGFPCLVVFGIDQETFLNMDSGKKRSGADTFHVKKIDNSSHAAAAVKLIHDYFVRGIADGRGVIDNDELVKLYEKYPRIQESIKYGRLTNKKKFLSSAQGTAMHYICARRCAYEADDFFEKLADGQGLKKNEPVSRLREMLIDLAIDPANKIPWISKCAFTIKAWNATRDGMTPRGFKWRGPKDPSEAFPRAR